MEAARRDDLPWHGDRIFRGGSYYGGEDVHEVANRAYEAYINYNALFANSWFPSLARYDAEVVGAVLDLMGAPAGAGGSLTSGGTESILMAVKTAHAWAVDHRPGAATPTVIVPRAAHPAFDKAGHLMGVRVVRLADSPDFRADMDAMAAAIDGDTIMLVGSAPSYPYGVNDPVAEIAALARARGLWLHVDACHGGMILPFARKLGYAVPDYDFAVEGVTSISVDVHKLGYSNKGVSVLLFRDDALERYQRYEFDEWPGGYYSTLNITGSRSGGGVASAWAVMQYLGEDGYKRIAGAILETRERLVVGIGAIDGLEVWGEPHAYLIAFGAPGFDILAVADGLEDRDWLVGLGEEPASIHLFLNYGHRTVADAFLADLAAVVEDVRAGRIERRSERAVYVR